MGRVKCMKVKYNPPGTVKPPHSERGMDLFDFDSTGILELQKVDESDKYESDDEAWDDFIETLNTTGPAGCMAADLLVNWRPYMHRLARRHIK